MARYSKKYHYLCTRNVSNIIIMVDLKNLKWDELTFIEMPKRDMNTKVRCTFRRAVPGSYKPDNSKCIITDLPKSWYDEFFQKGI